MKLSSATTVVSGFLLCLSLFVSGVPAARAQSTPAVDVVWSATNDFAGQMMDIDRFDNVYSVGDTIVGGIVLTRKFSADGILLWERTYRPEFAVKARWVAADPNGGAYVVGYKWTGSDLYPIGYFVLRYDADGNLVWSDVNDGSASQAVRAAADRAGNAYVTGGLYVAGNFTIGIVKYSPAGGRQWVCPVVNPNGTGFPGTPFPTGLYVSDNGSWIAASGTSGYNFYVLSCDESGFKRWQDFRDHSVYAAAVAVNNQGEVYFGNGLAGGGGMQIAKYSSVGVVQWTNVFSPGDYIHRLALDSLGNVIAIGPDYGGFYADWVTMKVAPTGVRLWTRTFDAIDANDEIPGFVAVDPLDNIYVTGVGGPAQSASNNFMRMVTLKYTADGDPVWMIGSVVGGRGNVVRVGGDATSLFVQGYGQMYTARYRQTGVPDVPAAPAALAATGVFTGLSYAMNLSWMDNAANELWYDVYRCSGSGCSDYVKIGRTTGENIAGFVDFAVVGGASYSYRVVAHGFAADSAASNSAQATTPLIAAPAAPGNLVAQYTGSVMTLTWTDNSSDEAQFGIERCEGAGCSAFSVVGTAAANTTAWTDFSVVAGRSYSYRVRAWTAGGGFSAYSNVATGATGALAPAAAPAAPSNLGASPLSSSQIRLQWSNNSSTQTGISIERCAGSCKSFAEIARVAGSATSFTDGGLASRTSYTYRLRAYNATGWSPYSASATAKTPR